jgi:hypothetical protein
LTIVRGSPTVIALPPFFNYRIIEICPHFKLAIAPYARSISTESEKAGNAKLIYYK